MEGSLWIPTVSFIFISESLAQIKYSWIFQCRGRGRERKMSIFAMLKTTLSAKDNLKAWTLTWSFKLAKCGDICHWSLPASALQRGSHLSWQKHPWQWGFGSLSLPCPLRRSIQTSSDSQLWQQRSSQGVFAGLLQTTNHNTRLALPSKGWRTHLPVLPLDVELPHLIF